MDNMFNETNSMSDLDTSNVLDMNYMFSDCSMLNDISDFDTSSVIDLSKIN